MSTENLTEKSRFVREARKRLGLTQAELAEKLRVSPNYLYQIESGRRSPGDGLLALLESIEARSTYLTMADNVRHGARVSEAIHGLHHDQTNVLCHFGDLVLGEAIGKATQANDWDSVALLGAELASRRTGRQKPNFTYPKTERTPR